MAVYTKITTKDIVPLFEKIGEIQSTEGITEGVENTNYLITLKNNKKLIFTIFEKRTKGSDLPFFNNAMNEFNQSGINCPSAISINDKSIFEIQNKPCAIYSFIEGKKISQPNSENLSSLGDTISKMHDIGLKSNLRRSNDMLTPTWKYIIKKFEDYQGQHKSELKEVIKLINGMNDKFSNELRTALIHADLFKDNIFFEDNKISGIIDFFFTCSDTIVYDFSTLVNAWFFDYQKFEENNFKLFFNRYFSLIEWNDLEKNNFNFYLKASAIRFFMTRLYDKYFNTSGEVDHKDPLEFLYILKFHEKNNLQDFF
jgi:homoserine kinase type II